MQHSGYTTDDFNHSPLLVFYEVTRACDLVCLHCRACAQPLAHPGELNTSQSQELIGQLARFPKPPILVFTGGDPFKRADIFDLVAYARRLGIRVAMTPSATPLVTDEALGRLAEAGVLSLAVSLDGADAATHDGVRGVPGIFERTLRIIRVARSMGLAVQINTTVTRRNLHQMDAIADLLESLDISLWSVFFLVPVGRGLLEQRIAPQDYEVVFDKLWTQAQRRRFAVKTTEAHHYRRFVLQQGGHPLRPHHGRPASTEVAQAPAPRPMRAPLGVADGRGVMFVSHVGQIFPSGFMPIEAGRFPHDSVVETYQHSDLFQLLRDHDRLHGKCGVCEYREVCGGSRARAYAVTRDPMASEPDCVYVPKAWRQEPAEAAV